MKMKIERKKISELKPAPYNPRIDIRENKYFYEKLYRSIKQFGLVEPIVWNKRTGHVVGGNQRLQILKDDGVEEVDVVVVDLPLEEEKALNIALNKITGDWDKEKLADLLLELNDIDDFLVQLSGFTEKEFERITSIKKEKEPELKSIYEVVIECKDEEEQKKVYEWLTKEGYKCRLLIL